MSQLFDVKQWKFDKQLIPYLRDLQRLLEKEMTNLYYSNPEKAQAWQMAGAMTKIQPDCVEIHFYANREANKGQYIFIKPVRRQSDVVSNPDQFNCTVITPDEDGGTATFSAVAYGKTLETGIKSCFEKTIIGETFIAEQKRISAMGNADFEKWKTAYNVPPKFTYTDTARNTNINGGTSA